MKKSTLGYKILRIIAIIITVYLISVVYDYEVKKDSKDLSIYIKNSNIHFVFGQNKILIHDYEIRSLTEKKQGSMEYKKILERSVEDEKLEIILVNYPKYGIEKNHPYYLSISREGLNNEPGVVVQSINFCIKDTDTIYSEKDDEIFIKSCVS